MRDYLSHEVRNVAVLGHSGAGKTAVMESLLLYTKATDRFGKTSEGSSVIDFDPKKLNGEQVFILPSFLLNGKIVKSILSIHQVIWIM